MAECDADEGWIAGQRSVSQEIAHPCLDAGKVAADRSLTSTIATGLSTEAKRRRTARTYRDRVVAGLLADLEVGEAAVGAVLDLAGGERRRLLVAQARLGLVAACCAVVLGAVRVAGVAGDPADIHGSRGGALGNMDLRTTR